MKTYLLLPKIKIQNANALSSLCTIGFPAMTAWMGFAHALERKLRLSSNLESVHFSGGWSYLLWSASASLQRVGK